MKSRHHNLVDYGSHEGAVIVNQIVQDHPVKDRDDVRQQVVLFSVFVNCIQRLHQQGWPESRLVMEVFDHCEIARFIESMTDDNNDAETD